MCVCVCQHQTDGVRVTPPPTIPQMLLNDSTGGGRINQIAAGQRFNLRNSVSLCSNGPQEPPRSRVGSRQSEGPTGGF